jgi:hypothetical protein
LAARRTYHFDPSMLMTNQLLSIWRPSDPGTHLPSLESNISSSWQRQSSPSPSTKQIHEDQLKDLVKCKAASPLAWAHGKGWPRTPYSISQARHLLPFYALLASSVVARPLDTPRRTPIINDLTQKHEISGFDDDAVDFTFIIRFAHATIRRPRSGRPC